MCRRHIRPRRSPYFASVHYTSYYDAELAVVVLQQKKGATIGLVARERGSEEELAASMGTAHAKGGNGPES
jgi:hypothetical protein